MTQAFVSTGIKKLDELLEGGIPQGFTTLILGVPGSGIEILAKQLATCEQSLYFSTEETEDDVLDTMRRFNWPTENIEIIDIASTYSKTILQSEQERIDVFKHRSRMNIKDLISKGSTGMPQTAEGIPDFLAMMLTKITRLSLPTKIIINSLDFFLNQYPIKDVERAIYALKMKNIQSKGTLFVVMTKGAHDTSFERKIEMIADCIIELDMLKKGLDFERYLTIKKMRDYARKIGKAIYTIDDSGFVFEAIERIL